jgi:SAM-dependent methyltransferase
MLAADTPILTRVLSELHGAKGPLLRVLDAGCGTGSATLARFAHLDGVDVLGIDRSEAAIAEARASVASTTPVRFRVGELEDIDPALEQFDLVFCALVLHVAPDQAGTVATLWSLVAPGGRLIIRGLDDALTLCYPDSADNRTIAALTPMVFAEVDRYHGRTMPGLIARLANVATLEIEFPAITTLCRPGAEGRTAYFWVVQGWKDSAVMDVTSMSPTRRLRFQQLSEAIEAERVRFSNTEVFASSNVVIVSARKN